MGSREEKASLFDEPEPLAAALPVPDEPRALEWLLALRTTKALALLGVFLTPFVLTVDLVMLVTRNGPTPGTTLVLIGAISYCVLLARSCTRRLHMALGVLVFALGLYVSTSLLRTAIFVDPERGRPPWPAVETDHKRIAIIGGGPSGLSTLWMLKQRSPHRNVTLFEATDSVGGHSTTIHDGKGPPIDIGFIFSTDRYETYGYLFGGQYNVSRKRAAVSVHYHGGYEWGADKTRKHARVPGRGFSDWDNLGGNLTLASPRLNAEVERFRTFIAANDTLFRGLMPLGLWLSYEGFSPEFSEMVLRPLLTPLFVTAKGCMWQPAQATINHFKQKGFLSTNLDTDGSPPLYHTIGGVNGMYQRILADAKLPPSQLRMKTSVTRIEQLPSGKWQLTSKHAHSKQKVVEVFDEVVTACNARIVASMLVPTSRSQRMLHALLAAIDYDTFSVRLSQAAPDEPLRTDGALYHVFPKSEMVGSIDRILDVGKGDYKLEVWPKEGSPATKAGRVIATREWEHHRVTTWELLLTHRLLPRVNHVDGLHIAGDWTRGVGQNDALVSGLRAACAVGVPVATKRMLNERQNAMCELPYWKEHPSCNEFSNHCREYEA